MPGRLRRRMLAVASAGLLVLPIASGPLATPAFADGDPASDVLLGENVFYPYSPPVSASVAKTLNAETAAAAKASFPIKVALIASPVDLGVIPDLFGRPQQYANFLDQEISFQGRQRLLVVMATGFGVQGVDGPAKAAAAKLPKPAGHQSNDLARAAITAVAKMAAAAGHPIKGVAGVTSGESSGSGGGGSAVLLIVLIAAALATAGALVAVRRRRTTSPG